VEEGFTGNESSRKGSRRGALTPRNDVSGLRGLERREKWCRKLYEKRKDIKEKRAILALRSEGISLLRAASQRGVVRVGVQRGEALCKKVIYIGVVSKRLAE